MKNYPPSDLDHTSEISVPNLEIMGWFGSDATNIVVSSAANGKSEATLDIPIPFWEIVVISIVVTLLTNIFTSIAKNQMKKAWNKQIVKQVAKSRVNLDDV
jgi:hypothetical protein